jgi:hypothetical protein
MGIGSFIRSLSNSIFQVDDIGSDVAVGDVFVDTKERQWLVVKVKWPQLEAKRIYPNQPGYVPLTKHKGVVRIVRRADRR